MKDKIIRFELVYEADRKVGEIFIDPDLSSRIIVPQKPEITVLDALILIRHGKEVGKIGATYDFSNLPIRYHVMAISLIAGSNKIFT